MESEKDALKYCKEKQINYCAFSFALRSPDHMPQIAAMLYREILSATKGQKTDRPVWGHIYFGCLKSGYFCNMDEDKFLSVLMSAYAFDAPKRTSYYEGIQKVRPSLKRKANSEDGQVAFDWHMDNVLGIARVIQDFYNSPRIDNGSISGIKTGLERD